MWRNHETEFGGYLRELWQRAGMSQRDFAAAARLREPYISRVRTGHLKPPMREYVIDRWSEIVGASEEERIRLLDLAALDNTPERIRRKLTHLALAAAV